MIENADGKAMKYIEELTEAFVSQIIESGPDALILSGDLSFNGERESHLMLAEKLRRVEDAGIPVLVIPGNHDLDSSKAAAFIGDGYSRVDSVNMREFEEIYADLGFNQALSRTSKPGHYPLRMQWNPEPDCSVSVSVSASEYPAGYPHQSEASHTIPPHYTQFL